MVEHILANYLLETGKVTKMQLRSVMDKMDSVRVKLGLIAVSEGFMTFAQAEEVNSLQAVLDQRFGDIAVDKGYLSEEQVKELLKVQGNAYLTFAQTLVDEQLIDMEGIEEALEGLRTKEGFSISEIEDIKSDAVERIVPIMLPEEGRKYEELVEVFVRTITRLIDRHASIGKAQMVELSRESQIATQELQGENISYFTGMQEGSGALLTTGSFFGQMDFESLDEDALDAAAELLNCINGLYASARSRAGQFLELMPPGYAVSSMELPKVKACKIPVYVEEQEFFFLVAEMK